MKLVSWNVNGIRSILKKGFLDFVAKEKPDILCLQETKAHPHDVDVILKEYTPYWNSAEKKGYAGTAVFTQMKPLNVFYGHEKRATDEDDKEGRVLTLEFKDFFLVNVYTPNSQRELARLKFRQEWDKQFLQFLTSLEKKKSVVVCGDLNVAHQAIDLANPKSNYNKTAGYTQVEIDGFSAILDAGFVDTFRHFNKEPGHYTWWSYMFNARAKNIGWRIDYFCVSKSLLPHVKKSLILSEVQGSDHCPVELVLEL